MVNTLCLLSLLAVALASVQAGNPHGVGRRAHSRSLTRGNNVHLPEKRSPIAASSPIQRRQVQKRCKSRSTSASSAVATTIIHASSTTRLSPTTSAAPAASSAPATTSVAAAAPVNVGGAEPSSSDAPATTSKATVPTTTHEAAATTTHKAAASTTPTSTKAAATTAAVSPSSGNSLLTGTKSGQGTFYGTGLGACGITNSDSDYIAAVSHILFDEYPGYDGANPNNNPICGKKVTALRDGKSVTVQITDRCTGCAEFDLDFSPTAFDVLAAADLGRVDITWTWN